MSRSVIGLLRVFLVLFFLGALLGQTVIIPAYASESAMMHPEVAFLAVPYTVVFIGAVTCLQAMLLAIWVLLSRVQDGVIFTGTAFRWVDVIIWSAAATTLLALLPGMHLLGVIGVGGPGVLLAQACLFVGGATFVLLMVVMRGLLRNATVMDAELAEVV